MCPIQQAILSVIASFSLLELDSVRRSDKRQLVCDTNNFTFHNIIVIKSHPEEVIMDHHKIYCCKN